MRVFDGCFVKVEVNFLKIFVVNFLKVEVDFVEVVDAFVVKVVVYAVKVGLRCLSCSPNTTFLPEVAGLYRSWLALMSCSSLLR